MKALRITALALGWLALLGGTSPAAEMGTPTRPNAGFDLMKGLAGTWERQGKEGVTTVRYEIVSEGTALMETISYAAGKASMVTVYHPDGNQLMMTHYCGANNQPRMRCAKPAADGKSLTFEYVDCSNLPTPETGHMHGLVIRLDDADHLTQEWTWMEKGKAATETFHYERKKS